MNYDRIYQGLMTAARCRGTDKSKLDGYYERHHILPKCLGGGNDEANLVLLTAREHFLAHRLLAKANPGNSKLLFAVSAFRLGKCKRYLTSRQIAVAREAYAAALRQRQTQLAAEGRHSFQTLEVRQAVSIRQQALIAREAHYFQSAKAAELSRCRNKALAAEGKHPAQTETSKLSLACRMKAMHYEGKHPAQTAEFREALRLRNAELATCPYCGKVGGGAGMRRWHFENCKLLK